MAIPWIKFEVTTSDKMEVGLIADILGIDPDAVVGKLLRVWAWFDENTIDGSASVTQKALQERYKCNASSVAKALLDRRVGAAGFCDAMIQVGWMVELDGTISLPNFDRHNGESAKKRAEGGKRVEKHRNGRNAKSVTDVTQNTLPDKIREDKNIEPPNPLQGESGGSSNEEKPDRPKRKPKTTIGEFQIPSRLDYPEVREALEAFERMRLNTGRMIRDRSNVCRGWDQAYRDKDHLLVCINLAVSNEWQGIKPDYVDLSKPNAVKKPDPYANLKKY